MELKGKRVLLTGATGGIGREIAKALAAQGAELVLVGRSANDLNTLVSSLPNGAFHQGVAADIASIEGLERIQRLCWSMKSSGRPVDVLINNAGCNTFRYLQEREPGSLRQEIDVNLVAPILLSQQALHWLSEKGVVLNVGSTFGAIGFPGYANYCASKAGLQRFSEALNREVSGTGKRVQYFAPRATNTSLNDDRVMEMNQKLGNKTDDADRVAVQIVEALKSGAPVTWLGWPEKVFVRLNQIFPSLVGFFIRQQHQTITEYASKPTANPKI
ncbi:SDR family oxidoreductase [Enterovibrio paralichthyis]|uniref:SDR family oxidoreductase n=1 Tax=Enterovibrio paralichthyis TaxID=2853805 RepID=UPI001C48B3B5|nr:SDR family oxidoreductase [Enterovibrio paralichthyis]MBV7296414.1 SDR family oxidoreductase [Enterovibrio paralichthyis]